MLKKVTLALGCLALLASFTSVARADAITFSFAGAKPSVTVNASGLSAGPATLVYVTDTKTGSIILIGGTAAIATGPASSYTAAGSLLDALYLPGSGIDVQVNSSFCSGGTMPGVCLQGVNNSNGQYVGKFALQGSFQALFTVTYVSPNITSLFGEPNLWLPSGSDSLTTSANKFKNAGTTGTAQLGGGSITISTPTPEPGTLAMCGTGMIGLAGLIRRRKLL